MKKELQWLFETPIAHRGLHTERLPENSLGAFSHAVEHGFPIELDVRMTKDHKIVVFHDRNTKRLTSYDRDIEKTLYSELQDLRLSDSTYGIPLLEEVLSLVNGSVGLLIEIKNHENIGLLERILVACLENYQGDFALQSFDPIIVRWFQKNRPDIIVGQISGSYKNVWHVRFIQKILFKYLIISFFHKPDFIAYEYNKLNPFVKFLINISALKTLGWTIKNPKDYLLYKERFNNLIFEGFDPNL